jgi:hypothetical protein
MISFKRVRDDLLYRIEDPVAAFFMDTDETGRQDLIVTQNHGTRMISNNYRSLGDFEYFKATVVNPPRNESTPQKGSNPLYLAVPGQTVKISYDGRAGLEQSVCTQCPQASFLSLQPCSCMFGIRNIANYIQEMAVGGGGGARSWSSLMPNAMAIVWRADSPRRRWRVAYFTRRRSQQMQAVVVVLSTTLILLAVSIIYLHAAERDDEHKGSVRQYQFAS